MGGGEPRGLGKKSGGLGAGAPLESTSNISSTRSAGGTSSAGSTSAGGKVVKVERQ
jgi:hypothetical protein